MAKKQQQIGGVFGGENGRSGVVPGSYVKDCRSYEKDVVKIYADSRGLLGAIRKELDNNVKVGISLILDTGYVNPYTAHKIIFYQWCEHWLTT